MVTVHDDPELGSIELVKGAPEQVVALCGMEGTAEGGRVVAENDAMASRGLRVLGCAWRIQGGDGGPPFVLLGLVGLRDPPRPGVREAIASLADAGIRTFMVTGDQRRTALAIARELGIEESAVYSRVTPDAKVDIVEDFRNRAGLLR